MRIDFRAAELPKFARFNMGKTKFVVTAAKELPLPSDMNLVANYPQKRRCLQPSGFKESPRFSQVKRSD